VSAGFPLAAQQAAEKTVSPPDALAEKKARSPLAELLHALNQPLTGLQCSLEVALARPRTHEQYVKSLREGLALTERMRALVQAVMEVVEIGEEEEGDLGLRPAEMESAVCTTVEELQPVAEEKQVQISLFDPFARGSSMVAAETPRAGMAQAVFRMLESALALTACGTTLQIDAGGGEDRWLRLQWGTAEEPPSALQPSELGLLVAQAWLEKNGIEWERRSSDRGEILTLRFVPGAARGMANLAKTTTE
jgi:signal transduction histidine kinase